jgi:hypothetical protein
MLEEHMSNKQEPVSYLEPLYLFPPRPNTLYEPNPQQNIIVRQSGGVGDNTHPFRSGLDMVNISCTNIICKDIETAQVRRRCRIRRKKWETEQRN